MYFGANSHEGSYIYGGTVHIYFFTIIVPISAFKPIVLWNAWMLPQEIYLDEDFLRNDMTETVLNAVEIDQARHYFFRKTQSLN